MVVENKTEPVFWRSDKSQGWLISTSTLHLDEIRQPNVGAIMDINTGSVQGKHIVESIIDSCSWPEKDTIHRTGF